MSREMLMKMDPTKMADWQIAEAAELSMKPFMQLGREIGLREDELIPMGRQVGKVDFLKVIGRLQDAKPGKYIDVTAITPTPLGEGKTTTTLGLVQGLAKLGKRPVGGDPPAQQRADVQCEGLGGGGRAVAVHSLGATVHPPHR